MQTINAKYTPTKQKGAQEVSIHIEGLPSGAPSRTAQSQPTSSPPRP